MYRFSGRSNSSEDFNCAGRSVKTGLIGVDVVSKCKPVRHASCLHLNLASLHMHLFAHAAAGSLGAPSRPCQSRWSHL